MRAFIVIAVIAVLADALLPTFTNVVERANNSAALQTARNKFAAAYAEALADDGVPFLRNGKKA